MEFGGKVRPVPNIPATPEKTRPNPVDHVIRKPADKGFPETLERIRNTPKPSGSVGVMPSGSGPSSLDKPSLYSGGGKAGQRFHPLVEKGIAEGRIDVADASWLSDYANTPGSSKVGTGSSSMPDQSQRMENFLSRVKSGEVQNPYPAEQRQPISKDLTGSSSFTREQLREQALRDQALNPRVGGGGGGADLERGMTGSRFKKPSYENGGNVNIDAMRLALMKG
jgi:hypothetical protein